MLFTKRMGGVLLLLPLLIILSCTIPSDEADLEEARFDADRCNPSDSATTAFCQNVIDKTRAVLAADPTNIEAGELCASAYMGLSGIDILQFIEKLVEVQNETEADFKSFRTLVDKVEAANKREINLDELRNGITCLANVVANKLGVTDLEQAGLFLLGTLRSIETFVRPVKLISFETDGTINADEIDDDDAAILEDNFINADNEISAGGTTDATTLSAMREGYCRCTKSRFGYSAACIRDMMRCEVSTKDNEDTEQDYDADGVTTGDRDDDCDALVNPPGVAACKDTNTT
ncbi:MAG: hypothetical protein HYW02_02585 [Deltaproteobacteria bacterium]|nr:hypothetical protein [Deltaproteobacteria bacterium]MBI2500356.1 hypothetical protein [Deltaproteobacteria bacterium]